ncbi:hypothetical protein HQ560_07505 [bacterium]|nr:hypothetical protein [bacterium]
MTPLAMAVHLYRGYPTWFFVTMVVACIALVVYFYFSHARKLPGWYFNLLLLMRVLVVVVLLLFIFQPELTFEELFTSKPSLAVLVDASKSMTHADPRTGAGADEPEQRIELASAGLRHGRLVSTLEKQFNVSFYRFGAKAEAVRFSDLDEIEANEENTDLHASCAGAKGKHTGETLAGIVLLTDGIDNSGKRVADQLETLGVPIFPVGFGLPIDEQKSLKNVAVVNVDHDDFVPKDNATEIKVLVDAQGYGSRPVRVVFRDTKKDKELASHELVLDTKKGSQRVTLKFTPREMGRIDGAIEIDPLPGEVRTKDNRQAVTVNVTAPRIKVLYIEGVLRAEGRWLMRTLQKDPNVELLYLVKASKGRFVQRGNIKGMDLTSIPANLATWKRFDVFILGDVHSSLFTRNQLLDLKEAVHDGRGLLLLGGKGTLGAGKYGGTPVDELSPVRLGSSTIGQEQGPFIWRLTDDAESHPIFGGITQFFPTRDREAETPLKQNLSGCNRVGSAKSIATLLAVHPTARTPAGKPMPVIATMNAANGKTMILTADTTHVWDLPNKALGRETPYTKFWGQTVRWLASEDVKRDDKPGVTAYTDKGEYDPTDEVRLLALVRDQQGQASGEARVSVTIIRPTKQVVTLGLSKVDDGLGEYRGVFGPFESGAHEAVFEAKSGDERLGEPQSVKFTVGEADLEMAELSLNEALLRQIADRTGGRYKSWLGMGDLGTELSAEQDRKSEPVKIRLHHSFAFLLFFIAIATCEWYMRKRLQLA